MIRKFSSSCPFETLGIPLSATKKEVKAKYYELAKKFHPDANPGHSERFQEINKAYMTIMANAEPVNDTRTYDFNMEMQRKEQEIYEKFQKSQKSNQNSNNTEEWSSKHYIAM
jgi:DnaJ-class molecular chaperone